MALSIGGVTIAAPVATPNADQVFQELGTKFGLSELTVKYLVENVKCTSLSDFQHLFLSAQSVADLVEKIADVENKPLESSRLRQAWLGVCEAADEAKNLQARSNKDDEDIEAVLPKQDLDRLYDAFWRRHKIEFAADVDPSDGLVSRRHREISRRLLTVSDPLRAKTLAHHLQQ